MPTTHGSWPPFQHPPLPSRPASHLMLLLGWPIASETQDGQDQFLVFPPKLFSPCRLSISVFNVSLCSIDEAHSLWVFSVSFHSRHSLLSNPATYNDSNNYNSNFILIYCLAVSKSVLFYCNPIIFEVLVYIATLVFIVSCLISGRKLAHNLGKLHLMN